IDVAEIYNPFTYQEILYYELFGFCKPGEGYKLVLEGVVTKDGEIACDPSGGVLCTNPIGASGLIRVAEAALQVMGEASNQVDGCVTALAHAMGGVNQLNGLMVLGR
ncbi:thiolase domain-containing protein, partial [Thermococci archaeon]